MADYRSLIADLTLPDPDDRHVFAPAIAAKASVTVTWNLKDFPSRNLLAHGVTSKSCHAELFGHKTDPESE